MQVLRSCEIRTERLTRAFIAIDLSERVRNKLEERSLKLQDHLAGAPIRWVRIPSIHLTLKFLGDSSNEQIMGTKDVLSSVCSRTPTFSFDIGDLGAFPNPRRARVIWVGIEDSSSVLKELQKEIDQQLIQFGYLAEKRAFTPHLTLARVKKRGSGLDLSDRLRALSFSKITDISVDQVKLFQSDLRSGGAVYTCLHSAQLSGDNHE